MNTERVINRITGLKDIFQTRPSDAQIAWEKERRRLAVESVSKMPVGDIEIIMDNSAARRRFIYYFNIEKRLEKRLKPKKTAAIEDPNHELQTEF